MEREVVVGGGKACNEVILESVDGLFGSIAAVDAWQHEEDRGLWR